MNIGQASRQTGISAKMIRYYEEMGILAPAQRSSAGYRVYSEHDLKTLHFLRHARDLGFSSEQMKDLVALWKDEHRHSAEVKVLANKHIDALKQKIAQLRHMVDLLEQASEACRGDQQHECAILESLEQGVNQTEKNRA